MSSYKYQFKLRVSPLVINGHETACVLARILIFAFVKDEALAGILNSQKHSLAMGH